MIFMSFAGLPFLGYSQSSGPPTPFNDKPEDFEDGLSIDSHVVLLFILSLVIAYYFLVIKMNKIDVDET